ncbi:c-type cytochrome domain-containing protein [Pirellulaceae bacterium SH449]
MFTKRLSILCLLGMPFAANADEPTKVTFDDHIKPIFREHCTSCHNVNEKKSGLALDTYQSTMEGGSSGEVVYEGDLDSSRLYALTAHLEQPYMPPNQDMIPQVKVDLIKQWIEQGMPENSGSEIKKPKANSMALAVVVGRPEGAPPMPKTILKQTPFATERAATTSAIAASPWSPLVAVAGQMQVSLYHTETGELLGIIPFPEGEVYSITFSRDGRLILLGGGRHSHSGLAALYEIETGNRIAKVGDELDVVLGADISDDNTLIAIAGPQKMVRVYDTLTGELKFEQKKHTDWIYTARFSPDGLLLATGDRSSGLVVWETHTGRLYMDLQAHKGEIRSITWRPDSAALISSSTDGTLKMWDMNNGNVIKSWDAHPGGALAVATCNDGTIASTGRDNKVKVWDAGGNLVAEMPALVEAGHQVAISVDSKQVIAGDWAGNVRLWQRADPTNEKALRANPAPLEEILSKLSAEQDNLSQLVQTLMQRYQSETSQQAALQQQLQSLQAEVAQLQSDIQASTSEQNELKPIVEQLDAKGESKKTELASTLASVKAKRGARDLAARNLKEFETQLEMLIAKGKAEGEAEEAIQSKTLEVRTQCEIQRVAMGIFASELQPLEQSAAKQEEELATLSLELDPKKIKLSELAANLKQWTEQLAEKERQIEPTMVALTAAVDKANATKAELEQVQANLAVVQEKVQSVQSDLSAFENRLAELTATQEAYRESMESLNARLAPVETDLASKMKESEELAKRLSQLETQIAEMQKQLAEEKAKKESTSATVAAHKDTAASMKEEQQKIEADAASLQVQLDLFRQAFQK